MLPGQVTVDALAKGARQRSPDDSTNGVCLVQGFHQSVDCCAESGSQSGQVGVQFGQ